MSEALCEREARVRALLPLVRSIARRVQRMVPGADLDDLIGDGSIGLIRAVDSYDPSRGPSLAQYAGRVVARAMLNGFRRLDPVSERVRREIRDAERERFALAGERGELPSQSEMQARRPALRRAQAHAQRYSPLSLDGPLPAGERLAEDWSDDPAAIVGEAARREQIRRAVNSLPARERDVLALHYYGEESLHAVGRRLAVSPQRASQLHLAALRRLRVMLDAAR